jgi:hexosaminidase
VVRVAASRGIRVIPEIEMPGHASAALAAYPHLGCTGGPYSVETRWGIFDNVLCAGKESTFDFIESVLAEVVQLFPDQLIHIGGDECPTVWLPRAEPAEFVVLNVLLSCLLMVHAWQARWAACPDCQRRMHDEKLTDVASLHSYFVSRVATLLKARWNKEVIGWDELLDAGNALPNGAIIMSWRGSKGGVAAMAHGHRAIMSPTTHCYFDFRQSHHDKEHGAFWASMCV